MSRRRFLVSGLLGVSSLAAALWIQSPASAQGDGVGVVALPFARGSGVSISREAQVQFAEMLASAIVKSPRLKHLRVVEHSRLAEILGRLRLEAGGRYSQQTQAEVAGLVRARYLLVGTIDKATAKRLTDRDGPIAIARNGGKRYQISVGLTVTLVDPSSGARLESWETTGDGPGDTSNDVARAAREAANEIATKIARSEQVLALKATVSDLQGIHATVVEPEPLDEILVEAVGLVGGQRYTLKRLIQKRNDRGEVIFTDRRPVGLVEVVSAQAKGAMLKLIDRSAATTLAKGDEIELVSVTKSP